MLRITPLVRGDRAVLEISQTGSAPIVIEHIVISRSGAFATGTVGDILVDALMNLAPGDCKYVDLTDTLIQLFDERALVRDVVWVAFICDRDLPGQPAPVCLAVGIENGKITHFDPFTPNN